ncbi:HNH endonuclease [Arthrobacter phage Colucci]|uniref:HNH endonuclease n=1 Tax=Arthrobacter phage Colucci TaxID=2015834 RepID=A0A286N326_9CAUD|nr:endonuclease [Arthrobacter phage Colucci]ASX98783.1 HNH endonuclease [Arthrobacter phage Colucci]
MLRKFKKADYPLDLDQQAIYVQDRIEVEDGHHIWQLALHKVWGYPRGGQPIGYKIAYRAAWEVEHGERLPSNVLILPTCERPECVNPAHMVKSTLNPGALPKITAARLERLTGENS